MNFKSIRREIPFVLLISIGLFAILLAWGVRTYGTPFSTQNGGITYGQCGVEIWGEPGHFCGDY